MSLYDFYKINTNKWMILSNLQISTLHIYKRVIFAKNAYFPYESFSKSRIFVQVTILIHRIR